MESLAASNLCLGLRLPYSGRFAGGIRKGKSVKSGSFTSVKSSSSSSWMDLPWQSDSELFFSSQALELENLQKEAPLLRKLCEDLDWEKQVKDLRRQAINAYKNTLGPKYESSSQDGSDSESDENGHGFRISAGTVAAVTGVLLHGCTVLDALAGDPNFLEEVTEASSRVPGWLSPSVLAFPLVSYVLFTVYRQQLNPDAKVSDWMFAVVSFVIVANLVLIATVGVRLY